MYTQSAKSAKKTASSAIGPTRVPAEVIDAAVAAIWPHVDRLAHGRREGHSKPQTSREALNRHFQAVWHGKFFGRKPNPNDLVDELNKRDIAQHVGEQQTIYTRSKWSGGILDTRWDVDCHNGQTDGPALMALFQTYFPMIYTCPSDRGISGYLGLIVPTYRDDDGRTRPACTIPEMNRLREQIHVHAVALAHHHGFAATIEVHGSFLERIDAKDENGIPNGPQTVADGALGPRTLLKLPTFKTVADVEHFKAAVIRCDPRFPDHHATGLKRLFADAQAAPPAPAPATPASIDRDKLEWAFDSLPDSFKEQAVKALGFGDDWCAFTIEQVKAVVEWRPAGRKRGGAINRVILPDPSGDILKDTRNCIARAKQILGYGHPGILELAMDLYESNGMERNPGRDRKRIDRFKAAQRFMDKTHDPSRASTGTDPNWWSDPEAIAEITNRFTGAGMPAAIAQFNVSKKAKRGKLSMEFVAVVANMLAKAATVHKDGTPNSTHAVPTSVIKKTLKKRGMNPDGTLINAAKRIIVATGCIEIVAAAVKPGWQFINNALQWVTGRAAQYRIVKWHWFPFLAHHAPAAPQPSKQAAPDPQTVKAAQDIAAQSQHAAGAISFLSQVKGDSSSLLAPIEPKLSLQNFVSCIISAVLPRKARIAAV